MAWKEDLGNVFSLHKCTSNYFTMCPGICIHDRLEAKDDLKSDEGKEELWGGVRGETVRTSSKFFVIHNHFKIFMDLTRR